MNWEVISNERSSLQEYQLFDKNDCKLIIKYNPRHQSARITCGNHHRLFFLESAGSLSGKTFFKNEYGMEIGSLVHDKFHPKEGSVMIDTRKYQYQLQNNPTPELIIFSNDLQKPVASCSLPVNKTPALSIFPAKLQTIDNNCYLLGLCWYLFLPLVKESTGDYASTGI
ncbi:MAG: hypothetical protein ABI760_07315 [Ferruginibacter sp.]